MDAELEDVKRELSKLKGCTIRTVPYDKPNHIEDISETRGFRVRATASPQWVTWEEVLGKYALLRSQKTLTRSKEKRDRGAFVMPLLAKLTTVEWVEGAEWVNDELHRPPLRYIPPAEGELPRLRRDVQPRPKRRLTVLIEKDEDGYFVASVPELQGCHTQGKTLDEAMENIRDAALLCLDLEQNEDDVKLEFIGVHTIEV